MKMQLLIGANFDDELLLNNINTKTKVNSGKMQTILLEEVTVHILDIAK